MTIPVTQRQLLLLLLMLVFSTVVISKAAFATKVSPPKNHGCQGGYDCNGGGGDAISESESYSESDSQSSSEATSSSGSDASADNTNSITYTRPSTTTVRNVVGPDTPNVYPTAPCRIARSAGMSFPGAALSGGSSIEDVECTLRETARAFQSLGVPEMGLVLLCKNSVVIIGRTNKKGELLDGQAPIGEQECLRLVRKFQRDADSPDLEGAVRTEIEVLREQQDRVESELVARVEQLEQSEIEQRLAPRPAAVVTQKVIQQPMLDVGKRAKLAALLEEQDK